MTKSQPCKCSHSRTLPNFTKKFIPMCLVPPGDLRFQQFGKPWLCVWAGGGGQIVKPQWRKHCAEIKVNIRINGLTFLLLSKIYKYFNIHTKNNYKIQSFGGNGDYRLPKAVLAGGKSAKKEILRNQGGIFCILVVLNRKILARKRGPRELKILERMNNSYQRAATDFLVRRTGQSGLT